MNEAAQNAVTRQSSPLLLGGAPPRDINDTRKDMNSIYNFMPSANPIIFPD